MRTEPDNKALLLGEQVRMLFSAVPNSLIANTLGLLLAVYMYHDVLAPLRLYAWCALMLAVTVGRYVHYRRFMAADPAPQDMQPWFHQFRIGSLLLAGVAGSAGFLLFDYSSPLYQLVLALMVVCIAAFAITTMSPSPDLVVTFLLLVLSPLTGSLLLSHAMTNLKALWMMPVATVMLIMSALRISKSLHRNMQLTVEAGLREKQLHEFQQRLALYVQQLPLAVVELRVDGTVTQWNPGAEQLFGYAGAETEGQSLVGLLASSRSRERLESLCVESRRDGKNLQFIAENRRKDGALLQCEWIVTPLIGDDGRMLGLIVLIQNVTQRMENERIKEEFVSIVSHELRTPVTSIKGSLALLNSGMMQDDATRSSELMALALENTNRLHMLINDILDVEKLESGHMDYRFADTDLCALLRQVATTNEPMALHLGIRLECRLPVAPCQATVDPDRIFQVLTNLLANAIKFSRPDSTVTLSLEPAGDRVLIGVRNFGEVIPDQDRNKLFTKFFQRDSSATRAKGGTGLGLYICQKILLEHHSSLDFRSGEAEGTFFFFRLPLAHH